MKEFINIKYIDPYYTYNYETPSGKMKIHEAYGFPVKSTDGIALEFIKNSKSNDVIIMGVNIPNCLLFSEYKKNTTKFQENKKIEILWEDIVYLEYSDHTRYSIFETRGIIVKNTKHSLIIKNPTTTRVEPNPSIKHPEKDPTFYVIPKSSIIKYEYL